jgi:transcriptional regulator with XRE-family HTH domain
MSGLNVRTIQRVEKGKSVGLETLKSLAAVFEISTDELIHAIENEKQPSQKDVDIVKAQSLRNDAHEKVKSIKYFYASSAFLIAIFLFFMLPNYNGGENLGPLIVVFISFSVLIAGHACLVFQPFGEKWEQEKVAKILSQQSNNSSSTSEH